jgi:hypothetical protein
MEPHDISELAEVYLSTANERLKQGWVFIRCLATLKKIDDDHWTEVALYVIGKPKREYSIADAPISE